MSAVPEAPLRITPDMLLSRKVDFERRMGRVPPVTLATLVLLAAIFVVEIRLGALASKETIIAMGALARERDRLLVRDRRVGFVLLIWAIYTIAGGLTDPFIDNGAHIGGALGGALIANRLHPVVLSPMPAERVAAVRRWLWLVVALLAYAVVGWLRR